MRKFDGLSWDERAVVLAKRLIPDLPSWLDSPKTEKHWIMLWACIGQELAEKEPEFTWGRGRHLGSLNKKLPTTTNPQTLYKRRYRDSQRAKAAKAAKKTAAKQKRKGGAEPGND
jgi:hypothetical protein